MTPRLRPSLLVIVVMVVLGVLVAGLVSVAQQAPEAPRRPGQLGGGRTLLPTGWTIAPAGTHLFVGDLPLNMVITPDERYAIVTNNGWSAPTLTLIDLERDQMTARVPVDHAWYGLAWHPDGRRLYSSGGAENTVYEFRYEDGKLTQSAVIPLGRPEAGPDAWRGYPEGFVGGLAISPDGRRLYTVQVLGKAFTVVDLEKGAVLRRVDLEAEPYKPLVSPDGRTLYVSLWGGSKVVIYDARTFDRLGEIATDEHPNDMVMTKDGARLFVACANRNTVWSLDLAARTAEEQISIALYPDAPAGSTPNALALSPDEETLLVANADNNTVAVVEVGGDGTWSEVDGFLPTGWYPTGVAFDARRGRWLVLSGKGLTSLANPRGPNGGNRGMEGQYTTAMLQGTLSLVPAPDQAGLAALTSVVYEVTPYTDKGRLAPVGAPIGSPIPREVGLPSPIRYVFYLIRENRTYDQILGDLERGNGDPTLALFGEAVTPNAHAIAREFVVFDNFYVNAEVSYDGHAYSTAAYATDIVEKMWPTNYGGRGGVYLSEGGGAQRNPFGNVAAPSDGYIWDFANRAGVSVRSYGEFADWERRWGPVHETVPGLKGKVHPEYPPYDLEVPDSQRVDVWLKEFREFERTGELPQLNIIRLPNDHTLGTRPGAPTPRAMIAENDQALGRIVEAISASRFWRESAIFVLEDDAQNGPDHVDAHRSVALVASPFARRGVVDGTLYTTASMLRTIELILGLEPMSQLDAAAAPMYNAFQPSPDTRPYPARAARVPLDERNGPDAPGAEASMLMDFSVADVVPELELNRILWQTVHGPGAVMPPPVRSAFVRAAGDDDERRPDGAGRER